MNSITEDSEELAKRVGELEDEAGCLELKKAALEGTVGLLGKDRASIPIG